MIDRLLARFPAIEVAGRLVYWRSPLGHRLGEWLRARRAKSTAPPQPGDFDDVIEALRDAGIGAGDILIVHASYGALRGFGLSAEAIVAALCDLLGPEGTLAMPTIPIFAGEPTGVARHSDAAFDRDWPYKIDSARIWTGALAQALMRTPGAVRSRCPANPMAAIGRHAEAMMRDNLAAAVPTPAGPGSSWHYCYEHGAKIAALGIDLVHSLTMIHVAEECFPERWTIPDWYRPRRYRVIDGGSVRDVVIDERRHGWSQYYAERAFSRDLFASGVARAATVAGVVVNTCDARRLVDFLVGHPRPFYPYVFPFGIRRSGARP